MDGDAQAVQILVSKVKELQTSGWYAHGSATHTAINMLLSAIRYLHTDRTTIEAVETPSQPITRQALLAYPDGTWVLTDRNVTCILATEPMHTPTATITTRMGEGWWWRRKQLMDQKGWPS